MSDNTPHTRHAEDAHADDAPPTDAVSDEVKSDAAAAEDHTDAGAGVASDDDGLVEEEISSPT